METNEEKHPIAFHIVYVCCRVVWCHSHFDGVQVGGFRLYGGEDHHSHILVFLCFSLPCFPVLQHTVLNSQSSVSLPVLYSQSSMSSLILHPSAVSGGGRWGRLLLYLLVLVGQEELEDVTVGDHRVPTHPGHPALQPLHPHLDKLLLKTPWQRGREKGRESRYKQCALKGAPQAPHIPSYIKWTPLI